jgi:ABC-2 type transport system ATP-binding protein
MARPDAMPAPPRQEPALLVEDVAFAYGRRRALDGVSFEVPRGSFTALLGPNGAGKTTLFSLIMRLLELRSGRIEVCGLDVRRHGPRALSPLGIVFQDPTLDLDLTVLQNLRYFARLRGLPRAEARRGIERELARFGLGDRAGDRVRALSGGLRRRVEIARALLHDPELLLLDEPTVGLDVPSRKAIVDHVHRLTDDGLAVLWATHLIDEVSPGDALVVLHRGKVRAQGPAEAAIRRLGASSLDEAFACLTADDPDSQAAA